MARGRVPTCRGTRLPAASRLLAKEWRAGIGVSGSASAGSVANEAIASHFVEVLVNCSNMIITGLTTDGGYAELVIVEARALAAIPDSMTSADAAPMLCAGVTTYNALRNAGLRPGDIVAIQGIGGLGHLAVQFARRMGFRTVAIARGKEKEALARQLGAHDYIDSTAHDPARALLDMGGANGILATASSGKSIDRQMADGPRQAGLSSAPRPSRWKSTPGNCCHDPGPVQGEIVGTAIDEEDTLGFSVLQNIHPLIESYPLERAPEAYARMMRNEARFRIVLTPGGTA